MEAKEIYKRILEVKDSRTQEVIIYLLQNLKQELAEKLTTYSILEKWKKWSDKDGNR